MTYKVRFTLGMLLSAALAFVGVVAMVTLMGCSDSSTAPLTLDPTASVVGTWTGHTDSQYFRDVTLNVTSSPDGIYGGNVHAVVGCPSGQSTFTPTSTVLSFNCVQDGSIVGGSVKQTGADATVTFSFGAPMGATFDGSLYTDGTLRGTLTVRVNTERHSTPIAFGRSR